MSKAMSVRTVYFTTVCLCYFTIVFGHLDLPENNVCDMKGSDPWTCQFTDRCPDFVDGTINGVRPVTCGFNLSEPLICCNVRPSQGWCSYYDRLVGCGDVGIVVIGGEKSLSKEHPHMALIGYGSQEDISWNCGGSLISDQFVLSAAHCTNPSKQIGRASWVRLGDLDISSNTDDAKPEDFSIIERIDHPEYNPAFLYNDIALYKLDRKVSFNEYIRPVCLQHSTRISYGSGTITGWGRVEFDNVCDMKGSDPWTCQFTDRCPDFVDGTINGVRPVTCGFNLSEPLICCNVRPSQGWCSYYDRLVGCGDVGIVVIGGEKSLSKEHPHMALIGYGSQEDISWNCGGSLISDQFVLSAAHCTNPSKQIGRASWVRLGDLDISSNTDDAKPEDFSIIERIDHPEYNPAFLYNDIALYKLDRKVSFNEYIRPVCLQHSTRISYGSGTITGWGRVEFAGPKSRHLMKAEVSFISNGDCVRLTAKSSQLPNGVDLRSQLCAGEIDGARDTCPGDSGGPLTGSRKCLRQQIGITSFGNQCGLPEAPGVYTRVSHFVPWIESIVWQ